MPRAIAGAGGLKVPGVYAALLDLERERNERSDRIAARMKAEHGYFMRCNNGWLAERLEAAEPVVVVCRARVELALCERSGLRERLPFDREVRSVEVSPDDRIVSAWDSGVVSGR